MRIAGQRARNGRGLPTGDRSLRWGALVIGVWTQRFARMWYVVAGLVPARIEVRSSNGLGRSRHPDLESQDAPRATTSNHLRPIIANDVTTTASRGDNPLTTEHPNLRGLDKRPHRSGRSMSGRPWCGRHSTCVRPQCGACRSVPVRAPQLRVFTAGVGSAVKQPDAAEALIKHLTAPNAVPVMKAKAMEPVAQ